MLVGWIRSGASTVNGFIWRLRKTVPRSAGHPFKNIGLEPPNVFSAKSSEPQRPHNSPKSDGRRLSRNSSAGSLGNELGAFRQSYVFIRIGNSPLATIHKVLVAAKVKPFLKPRRPAVLKRYSRPIPRSRNRSVFWPISREREQSSAWYTPGAMIISPPEKLFC